MQTPHEPFDYEWYFVTEDHQCITATPCGIKSLLASHRTIPKMMLIRCERFVKVVNNPNGEVYHIQKVRFTIPRHLCEKLKIKIPENQEPVEETQEPKE